MDRLGWSVLFNAVCRRISTRNFKPNQMTSDDEADMRVGLWIDRESVEDVASYAERGREHAALSDGELTAAWVQAFRSFAQDIHDQELRAAPTDYTAEFRLRGKEP